jgi:glycosyltransferase involved in cell wall biosynthesis
MKICMTSFSNLPLDARIQKEATSLIAAGHEIVLIGFAKNITRKETHEYGKFRQIWYPFVQMSSNSILERLKRALCAFRIGVQVYLKTLLTSADVYHSHEAYPLAACFLAAKLRGKKLVYDAHELYQDDGWLSTATLERLFVHKADAVINVNDARAGVLRQRYGLTNQTIVMNCPSRKVPEKSGRLREKLNIPDGDLVVIYHGGFYPKERALDELVRSALLLPRKVHVVILGFDSKGVRRILHELIANLRLGDRVHLLESVPPPELVEFATGADIGIIPQVLVSDNQRFANPNKLFDYMASQLAVVATDAPTITPIVRGFGIGEIFGKPQADEIARAIMKLIDNPAYLQACKKASRHAAEDVFFWEKEEEKLLKLYLNLQDGPSVFVPSSTGRGASPGRNSRPSVTIEK